MDPLFFLHRIFRILQICAGFHGQYTQGLFPGFPDGRISSSLVLAKYSENLKKYYQNQFYEWLTVLVGIVWNQWIEVDKTRGFIGQFVA